MRALTSFKGCALSYLSTEDDLLHTVLRPKKTLDNGNCKEDINNVIIIFDNAKEPKDPINGFGETTLCSYKRGLENYLRRHHKSQSHDRLSPHPPPDNQQALADEFDIKIYNQDQDVWGFINSLIFDQDAPSPVRHEKEEEKKHSNTPVLSRKADKAPTIDNRNQQEVPQDSTKAGYHILVVEDNLVNQTLIQRILHKEGYSVELAGDGLIALELIREKGIGAYSAILMDIQMPNMNGFDCTEAIRKMPDPHAHLLPIIGVSATTGEEFERKCLAHGMNSVISKPYSLPIIRYRLAHSIIDPAFCSIK